MSKSRKKKQQQRQAPTAIYRPTDTTPVQKHTDYLLSQSPYIDYPKMLDAIIKKVHVTMSQYQPRKSLEASSVAWTVNNKRNEDIPATPEPLYGLKKKCSCGASFWKLKNYQAHYAHQHIVLGSQPL